MLQKSIPLFVVLIILGVLAPTCFFSVEPDEEVVLLRFGKYVDTFPPGLHFKFPVGIDEAIRLKTQLRLKHEFGFRSRRNSGRRTEYVREVFHDESLMLTGDLNVAEVAWVVQFRIAEPQKYLFNTADPNHNIRDVSESVMRRVIGDRSVVKVLTVGKAEIMAESARLIQETLKKYGTGIKIESVTLQGVDPPDEVKDSFNEVNAAKQEQEKMVNDAEKEYNRVIPEARGKAEQLVAIAEGYSVSVVNRAKGDADKFRKTWAAYRTAPKVTRDRLYLEAMEDVLGRLKTFTVVDSSLKGLLPVYEALPKSSATGIVRQ